MVVIFKYFYADWIGDCKTQDPIVEDLKREWGKVTFDRINVDEEQDVANEYQVRSLPTLVIENEDGIVERFIGVTQSKQLNQSLEEAMGTQSSTATDDMQQKGGTGRENQTIDSGAASGESSGTASGNTKVWDDESSTDTKIFDPDN